jgi:hypothetical protein
MNCYLRPLLSKIGSCFGQHLDLTDAQISVLHRSELPKQTHWAAFLGFARSQMPFCVTLGDFGHLGLAPKDYSHLFHDQIIFYGCDPFNAPCDFHRFIDGLLRINEAAQLNGALVRFHTDLE